MTTTACVAAEKTEPPAVNVTVHPPAKVVDPKLAEALKRLPVPEQTAVIYIPSALRTIDGKPRLHGKHGLSQIEVTLSVLTSQCEATIQSAIQMQRPVEIKGKGRVIADHVPGYGYVSAYEIEDVTSCIAR